MGTPEKDPWQELWDIMPLPGKSAREAFSEGLTAIIELLNNQVLSEEQADELIKGLFAAYVEAMVTRRLAWHIDTSFGPLFWPGAREIHHGRTR